MRTSYGETKGDTQKTSKTVPFSWGNSFSLLKVNKNTKESKKNNTDGLGPSEVAMRATSPDP